MSKAPILAALAAVLLGGIAWELIVAPLGLSIAEVAILGVTFLMFVLGVAMFMYLRYLDDTDPDGGSR